MGIRITPEECHTRASALRTQLPAEFNELMTRWQNTITEMDWEGNARETFITMFAEAKQAFETSVQTETNEVADVLDRVGNNFSDADGLSVSL